LQAPFADIPKNRLSTHSGIGGTAHRAQIDRPAMAARMSRLPL